VANVPVPRTQLSPGKPVGDLERAAAIVAAAIPDDVRQLLETLWDAGHAAYVVGGGPRDVLIGRPTTDWDLATSALPEETAALFPGAVYENRFGTVAVRSEAGTAAAAAAEGGTPAAEGATPREGDVTTTERAARRGPLQHEITTFRSDHDYADFRRPHHVEFTGSIDADLGRRDFTINALAWGASAGDQPRLLDRHGGLADLDARLLRAVGDPRKRFEEDALRIVRAIRFAATLGFTIEPETLAALRATAPLVQHLSGERIAAELTRLLATDRPSGGLALLADTGVLAAISSDLAAQRGLAQSKIPGEDLWDHTLRTVDATPPRPVLRLAALLHDVGKPATAADGHFYRHEVIGAEIARAFLDRLRLPRSTIDAVVHLVRQHMFRYEPKWSDAAVRRFLAKVRPAAIEDLFALRQADNIGSGVPPDADDLPALRERVGRELAMGPILDRSALAIDGRDLIVELGLPPGPQIGRILATLFDRVVENPSLNERAILLRRARQLVAGWAAHAPESGEVATASRAGAATRRTRVPTPIRDNESPTHHSPPLTERRLVPDPAELSVQLYTVRRQLAEDLDATLARLASIGFRQVEAFDLLANGARLGEALPRHDLRAPFAHVDVLGADRHAVAAAAHAAGVTTVIQPWTEPNRWESLDDVGALADALNEAAAWASGEGLRIGYHNHQFELASTIDGRHALEVFAERLGPQVVLEVDAYWAHVGGADVPALLGRLGDRVVALHVKDGDGSLDTSRQVPAGSGVVPIAAVLSAAPQAVPIIEFDDSAGDLYEAIAASRSYVLGLNDG
jgi:tRNA nucleotidyltransferase (CCA-adding enzyme)